LGRDQRDRGPDRRGDQGDDPLHPVQPQARARQVRAERQAFGRPGGVREGLLTAWVRSEPEYTSQEEHLRVPAILHLSSPRITALAAKAAHVYLWCAFRCSPEKGSSRSALHYTWTVFLWNSRELPDEPAKSERDGPHALLHPRGSAGRLCRVVDINRPNTDG